jgi:hypothetical protein
LYRYTKALESKKAGNKRAKLHNVGIPSKRLGWRRVDTVAAKAAWFRELVFSDEDVLRVWRKRCPQLRRLWPKHADVSTWEGLTFGDAGEHGAAAGRVVEIALSGRGLTGSVPPELGHLAALKVLNLSDNQLTGSVPAALGHLAELRWLDLWGNQLTGEVPAALG